MSNINQDVQASHKVLTLLEKANAHSEKIIDELPGVFLVINEQNTILRGNLVSSRIFNVDYEDLLRTNFSKLFKHETWLIFQRHFQQLASDETKTSAKFELGICDHSDGSVEKPFYWHLTKMQDSNRAEGLIYSLMGEDISELRDAENRLSSIFANIPLGILTLDEHGNIEDTYSSFLFCLLGGGDFKGKSFRDVVFEPIEHDLTSDEKIGVDNIFACLNNEERNFVILAESFPKRIFFYTDNRKNEGKYLQISYQSVVYDGIVKRLLIILEDRTAIINAEKEQERANLIERQSRAIYESAIRDPLTGLFTRLYMDDRAEVMLNNHNRHDISSACLVMFDVDHFKLVNDTYGHDVGDKVLKEIAAVILHQARNTDLPVRFGGEEFMVFLPTTSQFGYLLAERVREKVSKLVIPVEDKLVSVTISGGIASHKEGESLTQLIKRADQMLYKAKKAGRNRNIEEDK